MIQATPVHCPNGNVRGLLHMVRSVCGYALWANEKSLLAGILDVGLSGKG